MKDLYKIAFIIICAVLGLSQSAVSQNLVQKFDGINFTVNGNQSMAPFNGGMDNARFQFVDIDNDGLLDLFTFDDDTTLYYYKNIGTQQNAKFKLVTRKFLGLYIKTWFYFVDIDNDSDLDMFAGAQNQTIQFFRNTGSASNPQLTLQIPELRTNTDTAILTDVNTVSVFKDIDNDGDMDFFTGLSIGTIKFYENIGTPNNFAFKYITDMWEDIIIISPADNIPLNKNPHPLFDNERHGTNALEFADINNDNDYDLFFGDLFSRGIYYIQNNGTPSDPDMAVVDSNYPGNQPFDSQGFNSVRMSDIDGDNDVDMFISVLYSSQSKNNFVLYTNNGTPSNPLFQMSTENYLNNVDVGSNSNIEFSDITGDGLADLLIGSSDQLISFYKNTGSAQVPQFTLQMDTLPLQYGTNFYFAPALADLDNDGDKDLIVGSFIIGQTKYYENTGTPQNFNFTFQSNVIAIGIDSLGQSSTPTFVDIDNDGDFDFFSGDWNGRIHYYENTGTASNFNFQFRSKFYRGIDVGDESVPDFYDIDGDGDFDLFIGRRDGRISYYKNEGSPSSPDFVFQTDNYKNINVTRNACPEFIDIDNDTDPDLFVGNIKGGMYFFDNHDVIGIEPISGNIPSGYFLHQNFPNPFNPSTNIKFDIPKSSFVELKIFDISGREIARLVSQDLNAGSYNYNWDAGNMPSGVYFYRLTTVDFISTRKMMFLK